MTKLKLKNDQIDRQQQVKHMAW